MLLVPDKTDEHLYISSFSRTRQRRRIDDGLQTLTNSSRKDNRFLSPHTGALKQTVK